MPETIGGPETNRLELVKCPPSYDNTYCFKDLSAKIGKKYNYH